MFRVLRDSLGACVAPQGSVVCIGAFDGVHLGHRALLARVRDRADTQNLAAVALSFEPIPREYFARSAAMPRIDDVRGKITHVRSAKADLLLLARFNAAMAGMSAEDFVEQVLIHRLATRELWVGADFRFGHARRGDIPLLQAMGAECGFSVQIFDDFLVDGERVRSSTIRDRLVAGDFESAHRLLGRAFSIGGHVVRGQQLGRTLGYPTANIRLGRRTSPVNGIFAVRVHGIEARALPGVASLGVRPTVNGKEPLLEAHLFDFDGDLYGRRIDVEFVAKLRDEEKFSDLEAMVQQIHIDAERAREILAVRTHDSQPDSPVVDGHSQQRSGATA
jgi:riboflavin kinase/FMN adenylyltransferase